MTQEEIKLRTEEAVKSIHDAQKELDAKNGKTNERIESLIEEGTKTLEKLQEIEIKNKASQEAIDKIETKISRINFSGVDGKDENKFKNDFSKYLRKGIHVSEDIMEEVVREMVQKSFHGVDEGWTNNKVSEMKALVEGVDPQGGFWVRPQMAQRTLQRIFETSPMRSLATIETLGTDAVEFIIDDNEFSSGGWVGETGTRSDTDTAEIGKLSIYAHEQYSQPKATQTMLDDAGFDIESWISRKTADKFARTENTAFVSGDGANKPKGFLSYSAWGTAGTYERGKIEQRTSTVSAGFDSDDLVELQNDLKEFYQPKAVWMMKRKTFAIVAKLKDGSGSPLVNPMLLAEGAKKQILGNQVVFADDMPTVAANTLSIAYGDFGVGYTIVDRIGIRILRDPFTSKPYVRFYTTKRTGGAVTNYEAIKILKISA